MGNTQMEKATRKQARKMKKADKAQAKKGKAAAKLTAKNEARVRKVERREQLRASIARELTLTGGVTEQQAREALDRYEQER